MGSSKYGITSAISDVVGGYEREEERQAQKAAGAQKSEMGQMKLDKMRGDLEKEGSRDALMMLLRGDPEGAMAKYNEQGEDRMSELSLDTNEGVVSWIDAKGEDQVIMLPHLMAMTGLDPKMLETPAKKFGREKELIEHKAKMAKQYGIGRAGKQTAYIQNLEYTMKKLTGGDARRAVKLMQLSKSDPQAAYARILLGLQKQNQEAFGEEKMTDQEMQAAAKDSVTSFRDDLFNELIPQGGGQPGVAQPDVARENDPMGLL